jgi:hypothetical protein
VGTGWVLLEQVNRLLRLRLRRLLHLLLCLPHLSLVVWVVVATVDGMVVNWRSQGPGIANVVYLYAAVRQEGVHGPSPMLGEYFRRCLRRRSLCVP